METLVTVRVVKRRYLPILSGHLPSNQGTFGRGLGFRYRVRNLREFLLPKYSLRVFTSSSQRSKS